MCTYYATEKPDKSYRIISYQVFNPNQISCNIFTSYIVTVFKNLDNFKNRDVVCLSWKPYSAYESPLTVFRTDRVEGSGVL